MSKVTSSTVSARDGSECGQCHSLYAMSRILKFVILIALAQVVALPLLCAAQVIYGPKPLDPDASWQRKDWKQWSSKECRDILEESPWVTEHKYSKWWGRMRIRSALPVRLALARQFLIKNGYDRARADKRKMLEQQVANEFLDSMEDRILVHYEYGLDREGNTFRLIPKGPDGLLMTSDGRVIKSIETISVKKHLSWSSESEEFTLVFPRTVDGKSVIYPQHVMFAIVIGKSEGSSFTPNLKLDFRLDNMIFNGKVEY